MAQRKNPKILVIDDDPTFCHTMIRLGASEKLDVLAYSSPREAYRDMEKIDFDVAIIDYDLGLVNGAQLSNYIDRCCAHQPIVLISGGILQPDSQWPHNVKKIENKMNGAYKIIYSALDAFNHSH